MEQITINYNAGVSDGYGTCREFVAYRVHNQGTKQMVIAAEMDYSPSDLSRKLAQSPTDSRRFTLDDLESFIKVTGDTSPVIYLVEKYLTKANRVEQLEAELARAKAALGMGVDR